MILKEGKRGRRRNMMIIGRREIRRREKEQEWERARKKHQRGMIN